MGGNGKGGGEKINKNMRNENFMVPLRNSRPRKLTSIFLVISWLVVIVSSGLLQTRGRHTDKGVTWPCVNRDPEARLVVAVSTKYSVFGIIVLSYIHRNLV
jgi:hypothetical protein